VSDKLYALTADPGRPLREAREDIERLRKELAEAEKRADKWWTECREQMELRDTFIRQRDEAVRECNRLAQRNTMLVNELSERGRVFSPEQLKAAIVKALYEGAG
jgi:hypothetical protein